MKKVSLIVAIIVSGMLTMAQEQNALSNKRDTIWLKTGIVISCRIIDDSTNNKSVYVYSLTGLDSVKQTRFPWEQIEIAHKQSKLYIPSFATCRVELKDGTLLNGKLISETETEIQIQLEDVGLLTINRDKIKRLIPLDVSPGVKKSFWFKNPHATRLLFTPTAIPLRHREGYCQNIYIINMFNYGVTDNLSIGSGFDFAFFIYYIYNHFIYDQLKYSSLILQI